MAASFKMLGKVRGISLDLLPTGREDEQFPLTGQGEQLVAPAAAPYQEIVRQGKSFWVNTTTAIASVTAIPTTAHALAIYNNAPDGGRSLIIDRVWALFTVNTAALPHVGIIGVLGTVRETAPTNAALTIKKLNGMGDADSVVYTILNATALPATTGIAANWFALGDSVNAAVTSLPGFQKSHEVNGRIIVPPGRYFALHTLGSVASSSAQVGIEWTEKVILNG